MLTYTEVIESQGVAVPFDPSIITPKIEKPLRRGRYEAGECAALRRVLLPGDRVLELGAGLGICSTIAAQAEGVEAVLAIEANPELLPLIRETYRLNGVEGKVDLRNGIAMASSRGEISFYVRHDFWASSAEPESRGYKRVEILPTIGLSELLPEFKPTVMICDIEGGELELFDTLNLSTLHHLIIELHPKVYGAEGMARIGCVLSCKGFYPVNENPLGSSVQVFERRQRPIKPTKGSRMPIRPYRTWPIKNPRVLVTTCMKDEGPFILEWLAWHRAIGVTDFVVYTNDCSDGTDRILDRLAARGELVHLPNPALASSSTAFQPFALAYTHFLPVFREADFVISMDVDEFINIRCGGGTLSDLFVATGPFDAISISELNHGSNGLERFEPGWIREQFPAHESETPGKARARRGVKTITRLSPRVARIRNHRPEFLHDAFPPLWLDGSGRYLDYLHSNPEQNGIDVRGSYRLVTLDHYALRSLDSFFMKTLRGDVVVANRHVSLRYWKLRNRNDFKTSVHLPSIEAAARAFFAEQFEIDRTLMELQNAACEWHKAMIAEVTGRQDFLERRAWIKANSWGAQ